MKIGFHQPKSTENQSSLPVSKLVTDLIKVNDFQQARILKYQNWQDSIRKKLKTNPLCLLFPVLNIPELLSKFLYNIRTLSTISCIPYFQPQILINLAL
jgi:hypothetical protein